jgi:hypothetical protein
MLAALGFLRALDRAISAARRLIVICLQDTARSMGLINSEFRAWLAPRFPRRPIEDVLQHRTQISGQPVLVIDAADPGRPAAVLDRSGRSGGDRAGLN